MADRLSRGQRSRLMGRITGENTGLERRVFALLSSVGLRFAKHAKDLHGSPDVLFRRARVVIFIEGDFWHGWQFDRWKGTLTPYWANKIRKNRANDAKNHSRLRFEGWKVLRVWEHQIHKDPVGVVERIMKAVEDGRRKAT